MSGAPSLPYQNVSVNFEVEVTGNSELSIFGVPAPTVSNVIVADMALPVNCLYDARVPASKKGLIEFWEPAADPDNIYVKLASTDSSAVGGPNLTDAYKVTLKQLAKGLQRVLCHRFDTRGVPAAKAAPYDDAKYDGKEEYTKQRDFSRVALGAMAHYLFGHVDATAAITNEVAFTKNMLSLTGSGANDAAVNEAVPAGGAARYAEYHAAHLTEIDSSELSAWSNKEGSAIDANLAKRLVAAIVGKGLGTDGLPEVSKVNDATLTTDAQRKAKLAYIVSQVAGQDATRLMNEDNTERTVDMHQLLRFYAGDVIYVNIKVNTPNVTVAGGQAGGVTKSALEGSYSTDITKISYTLKITLGEAETL
jgi:hypothetical protein